VYTEIEFAESAFKHGATEEDIKSAIDTFIADGTFENEPNKFLLIGFDTKGNLLEVIYSYDEDHIVVVFHSMNCRKVYLNQIGR
jgi:hypothetical protein